MFNSKLIWSASEYIDRDKRRTCQSKFYTVGTLGNVPELFERLVLLRGPRFFLIDICINDGPHKENVEAVEV